MSKVDMSKQHDVGMKLIETMEGAGLSPTESIFLVATLYTSMVQSVNMPPEQAKKAIGTMIDVSAAAETETTKH